MNNLFYQAALNKASGLLGRHGRIALLLSRLVMKISTVDRKDLNFHAAKEKIAVMTRLTKSYSSGQYKAVPWKTIATILGAFIYFVNPFDLIPDVAPVVGLTDDFSVLIWVYSSVQSEIDKFLTWEQSKLLLT
jgi:uncharacterized membrane protein YkvA (DUF1232 family)